jgi:formamidopyrimidine-DNA glycosylase
MSGRWRIDPAEIGRHDHFLLETDETAASRSTIRAVSGSLDLVRTDALDRYEPFAKMGPEPLSEDFSPAYLLQALKGRSAPIKALLLDQRIVAGLGNIYVCEALHMAGIAPARAGGRISRERLHGSLPPSRRCLSRPSRLGLDPARLCAAGRRARLFLEAVAGIRP